MAEPLRLRVATPADASAATAAVMARVYAEGPAPPVEITVAPGEYTGLSLQLGGTLDPRRLDITLVMEGVVLRNGTVDVAAGAATVRGAEFRGGTFRIHVDRSVTVEDVTIRDLRAATRSPGSRAARGVVFEALGPEVVATFTRLRLLDNQRTPALTFGAQPSGAFASVTFRQSRFGGNAAPEVFAGPVKVLTAEGCERMGGGEFVQVQSAGTLVVDTPTAVPEDPAVLERWGE